MVHAYSNKHQTELAHMEGSLQFSLIEEFTTFDTTVNKKNGIKNTFKNTL